MKKIKSWLYKLSLLDKVIVTSVVVVIFFGVLVTAMQVTVYNKINPPFNNSTKTIKNSQSSDTKSKANIINTNNTNTNQSTPEQSNSGASNTNTKTNSQVETPKVDYSASIALCNSLNASYTESYNADVNAANIRHQNNVSDIDSEWNSRGMFYSGGRIAAQEEETARYQSELAGIESAYQLELANNDCGRYN